MRRGLALILGVSVVLAGGGCGGGSSTTTTTTAATVSDCIANFNESSWPSALASFLGKYPATEAQVGFGEPRSAHWCYVVVEVSGGHYAFVITDYPTREWAMNAGNGQGSSHFPVPSSEVPSLEDAVTVGIDPESGQLSQ